MDNVTHSLVGIAFGELWHHFKKNKGGGTALSRSGTVAASLIGNNGPDLDFIYASGLDRQLGYLLHHRGHTHTIVVGLLFVLLPVLTAGMKRVSAKTRARFEFFGTVGLGIWLHILLDSLNSYGVHPFWPLDSNWYYLDTLFILEPLAWVAILPALIFSTERKPLRVASAVFYFGIIAAAWAVPHASWQAALLTTLFGLAIWYLTSAQSRVRRYQIGMAGFIGVVILFFFTGRVVEGRYRKRTLEENQGRKVVDMVLSPLPTNPFCWMVISIERGDGNRYYMRRGLVASFPSVHPVALCPTFRNEQGMAPLSPVLESDIRRYNWIGEYQGNETLLRELQRDHCQVRGFLEFARAPFLVDLGDNWYLGDLRFDFQSRLGFARFVIPKALPASPEACPKTSTPWTPPTNRW